MFRKYMLIALLWAFFYTGVGSILGLLILLYYAYGFPGMCGGIGALYLFHLWLQRRTPIYLGENDDFWFGDGKPPLPPPSAQAQLGSTSTALTPSRPGPVARR